MSPTDHDLFGQAVPEPVMVAKQLPMHLGMGMTLSWGSSYLRVSSDVASGSIRLSAVDLPDLGPRWAAALKLFWPGRKPGELDAKRCATAMAVDPRTAEAWAAGQAPRGEYLWRALALHGRAFLVALAPELAPPSEAELLGAAEALRSTSIELAEAMTRLAKGER